MTTPSLKDVQGTRPFRLAPTVFALVVGILIVALLDLYWEYEYATLPLYFLAIMAAAFTQRPRFVVVTGVVSIVLAVAGGYVALATGQPGYAVVAHRGVGVFVMAVVTTVTAISLSRSMRLKRQREELLAAIDEHDTTRRMVDAAKSVMRMGTWTYSLVDNPDDIVEWTDGVCEIHGVPYGTHPTRSEVLSHYDLHDGERIMAGVDRARILGERLFEEARLTTLTGERRVVLLMAEAVRDATGQVVGLKGVTQDITMWREAESAVDAQRRRFAQMASSMPFILWTATSEGQIDYFNDAVTQYSGIPLEELMGDAWAEHLVHPDDMDRVWGVWTTSIMTGQDYEIDFRLKNTAGEFRWHHVSAKPERDEHGDIVHWWGCAVDIEHVHQLREQLGQSQRLESVGRLTGGIAHDFNNLLTVVVGATEAIESDPTLSPESREMAQLVLESAQRGAELTHRLLAFARRQPLHPAPTDICTLLSGTTTLLARTLGEGIRIHTEVPDDLPLVRVDPSQLEHALINLAINARDAMQGEGDLTVTARVVEVCSLHPVSADIDDGEYVTVSVADTGSGIDPAHMQRLFEPFFTTKGLSEGSGLGLPLVWGFAKQSGGHVAVESQLGKGSTFTLYLPLAHEEASSEEAPAPRRINAPGNAHILVVEDDVLVQRFAAEQLRHHGYTVTLASTGPEALAKLKSGIAVDMVFTDVIMPGGMTGRELADRVREQHPDMPVLFTSGYTDDVLMHNSRMDPDVVLLAKPYSSHRLIERVQDVLRLSAEELS